MQITVTAHTLEKVVLYIVLHPCSKSNSTGRRVWYPFFNSLAPSPPCLPPSLDILAQPANAITITLPHDNRAHENLNRPDALQRDLALARRLIQAQLMSQLVLADRIRVVDLVSEDQEGRLGEVFHGQERVELGFGLGEALWVFGVDQEHDPGDFGEVVFPQAAGLLVAAEVEGREADAADAEFFRRRVEGWLQDGYAVVLEHVQELDGEGSQVSFVECAVG